MPLKKTLRNVIVRSSTILLLLSVGVHAGVTELAGAPVNFLVSSAVKPNIYFILDDSGSMLWSYAGDEVVERGYEKTVGYRSHRCNKSYYNPAVTYPVPVTSDGSAYAAQSFTAARYDGFNSESVTVNLSSDFLPWRTAATEPALPANTDKAKYRPDCRSIAGECTAGSDSPYPNTKGTGHYVVYIGNDESHLGDAGVPIGHGARKIFVLIADIRSSINLLRTILTMFPTGIPITIGRQDREVLLAGVLDRIISILQQLAGIQPASF